MVAVEFHFLRLINSPSPTQSTDSEATLQYDYSDVPEDEDADKPQDQHAETVMVCEHEALRPARR